MGRHEESSPDRAGHAEGSSPDRAGHDERSSPDRARQHEKSPAGSGANPTDPAATGGQHGPSGPSGDVPLRDALRPSGPPRLELRVEHGPESTVVHLEGELDILTAPKLGTRVDELIRGSAGDVRLDLRAVRFIDSAGLQLLLTVQRRLARASRKLSVMCVDGPVMRVIELSRLTETLGVINS